MSLIYDILEYLKSNEEKTISEIKESLNLKDAILPHLLWLEKMGFIIKKLTDERFELITSIWKISNQGDIYLEFIKSNIDSSEGAIIPNSILVYTCPPELKDSNLTKNGALIVDVMEDLLLSSNKSLIIASPYIDQSAIPFLQKIDKNVKVRILTESITTDLQRLSLANKNIEIKKLKEYSSEGVQMYQVHAKFICVDDDYCLIMSANLKATSLYHNFEVGVMTEDKNVISSLKNIFEILYNKLPK